MRIGDDEAVVIEARRQMAAIAALAVIFQQGDDHLDRLGGRRRALQCQAQQVHADQRRLFPRRRAGVDRLVADHHAVLVGAHLGAPHPERPAQQHGVRAPRLRDGDVGAGDRGARRVIGARRELDHLRLVALAIAVLAEQHDAVGRCVG